MFRFEVEMKKGNKKIYGKAYTRALILDYIKQQEQVGFVVVYTNFEL